MPDDNLTDAVALATRFGVTVETVNRWVRERRIPFIRVSRRTVRFRLEEVEKVLRHPTGQGVRHGR